MKFKQNMFHCSYKTTSSTKPLSQCYTFGQTLKFKDIFRFSRECTNSPYKRWQYSQKKKKKMENFLKSHFGIPQKHILLVEHLCNLQLAQVYLASQLPYCFAHTFKRMLKMAFQSNYLSNIFYEQHAQGPLEEAPKFSTVYSQQLAFYCLTYWEPCDTT